jgi:hypothetical protein
MYVINVTILSLTLIFDIMPRRKILCCITGGGDEHVSKLTAYCGQKSSSSIHKSHVKILCDARWDYNYNVITKLIIIITYNNIVK